MAELTVRAALAKRGLDVEFTVKGGEILAVLGPNGSGKSTIAAVIAGLLGADQATVAVGTRILTDTTRGVAVTAHHRRTGLLLQNPLLFPHLTVLANVAFASRRHLRGTAARIAALGWLDQVGAGELADRRPGELSGGQAQRVALARALAAEPEVLLLDEPLAGLDVAAAASARAVLQRLAARNSRPVVLITHDILDVLALADRVLVLEAGRSAEVGSVAEVLAAPRSRFGARIAGVNLVRGIAAEPGAVCTPAGQLWHGIAAESLASGQDAVAVFSPAAVAVYREQPHGSPRNSVRLQIAELEVSGASVRVRAVEQPDGAPGLAAEVTAEAVADLRLVPNEWVWFTIKTQGVRVHAATRTAAANDTGGNTLASRQ